MDSKETLTSLFQQQVQQNPRKIAVIHNKQSYTYAELNERANKLAHYLLQKGVSADTPIAFCLTRSIDVIVSMLAILKAGGGYLPIDASQPDERLLFILEDSKAPILITHAYLKTKFSNYTGTSVLLDQHAQEIKKHKAKNPEITIKPEQLAYVIYTSGSTGTPKGVLIEQRSVVNYCSWLADYSGITPQERVDFSSNHIFDMSVTVTIASLVLGLCIVICDDEIKNSFRMYLEFLKRNKISLVKMTPSYLRVLYQEVINKAISLPYLKTIILGGEGVNTSDCAAWLSIYPNCAVYNEYGPTETTVGISVFKVSADTISSIGTTVPMGREGNNMHAYVVDATGNIIETEETGELYVGGLCLARGYLNKPELTAKQFVELEPLGRVYKTGDLCRRLANGVMEYCGRIDEQVKIRGFRVEPGEVEKQLSEHPQLESAVVVAQKDANNDNRLVAYYIPKEGTKKLKHSDLRQFLKKRLPEYMIPGCFVSLTSIPLTANGKLDKAALPKPTLQNNQAVNKPLTDLEKALAEIWAKELGISPIGLDDDFFELGGHSLIAGRIISKINSTFGKEIHVHHLYQAPTIAKLAGIIKTSKNTKRNRLSVNKRWLNKATDIPLCDFQFIIWISNTFEAKVKKLNITIRKRVQGQLNKDALELAFQTLLKKQEVLNYHISKFRPAQMIHKKRPITISEYNLDTLSWEKTETALENSLNQLNLFNQWSKDAPLIIARLFPLKENQTELQISMPHIISDDATADIILTELSKLYVYYNDIINHSDLKPDRGFKEYVFNEQFYVRSDLDRDIQFWENYMVNASLFTFPKNTIVKKVKSKDFNYSTFVEIPEQALHMLKEFCAKQHISINEGLCAVLALALSQSIEYSQAQTPYIFMNIVKSTRDNPAYDQTVGCFLRIEPIKIQLDKKATLPTLIEQIHQSTIDTSLYQRCPGLIKLASASSFRKRKLPILQPFMRLFSSAYAYLFKVPKLYQKVFNHSIVRLASKRQQDSFLININVQSSFINKPQNQDGTLFGLEPVNFDEKQRDLLRINNIFDVCFLRKDQGDPYLAISTNLYPAYREHIAKEVVRIMESTAEAI